MISIVIPCHNEEKNISILYDELKNNLPIDQKHEIIFVNDGSADKTLEEINKIIDLDNSVKCINFVKNFGHQIALKAGFDHSSGDCVITMDADLQHPPHLIKEFIEIWKNKKIKVIHAIKKSNSTSLIRKFFIFFGYRIANFLSTNKIEIGGSDFCLYDKQVVNHIKALASGNLMFRSFTTWMGFKKERLFFHPPKRKYGKTTYDSHQLIEVVRQNIVRFSIKPIRIITSLGILAIIISFCLIAYYTTMYLFLNNPWPPGFITILCLILLFGGLILFSIGIIGEYLSFLIMENSKLPTYIIDQRINFK